VSDWPDKIEFATIKELVHEISKISIERAEELLNTRSFTRFSNYLGQEFYNETGLGLEAYELGVKLINDKKGIVQRLFTTESISYIDSPMMLDDRLHKGKIDHWQHLKNELIFSEGKPLNKKLQPLNIEDILDGRAGINSENIVHEKFTFHRSDGKEFNLSEVATGIKSFAILQLLLQKGLLTKKTLLIIDEPEAHLHPQWVVEYARIMVLLNKELGVKFLIASHHPDMISAIKYISEKEGVDDKVNFYLAEKSEEEFQYTYRDLGTDIDPIFESFNIALDRMDQYGATE
jgi:predicted ATP-binding protein involved in virulence